MTEPHPFDPFAPIPPSGNGMKGFLNITSAYYTSQERAMGVLSVFANSWSDTHRDYSDFLPYSPQFDNVNQQKRASQHKETKMKDGIEDPYEPARRISQDIRTPRLKRSLPRSCKTQNLDEENDKQIRSRFRDLKERISVSIPKYSCYCAETNAKYTGLGDLVCDNCDGIFHQHCLSIVCDPPPLPGDIAFEFICQRCNAKRGREQEEYFLALVKDWTEITEVALYNLYLQNKQEPIQVFGNNGTKFFDPTRQYFLEKEILQFIESRWSTLCYGVNKYRTWQNSVRSTLRDQKHFFRSVESPTGDVDKSTQNLWWGLVTYEDPIYLDRWRGGPSVSLPNGRRGDAVMKAFTETSTSPAQKVDKPVLAPPSQLPPIHHKLEPSEQATGSLQEQKENSTVTQTPGLLGLPPPTVTLPTLASPPTVLPVIDTETDERAEAAEGDGNEGEEEEFVVEKIVAKRISNDGSVQYKIKWLGYNNRYNCWVQADDMNCPDQVAEYEACINPDDDSAPQQKEPEVVKPTKTAKTTKAMKPTKSSKPTKAKQGAKVTAEEYTILPPASPSETPVSRPKSATKAFKTSTKTTFSDARTPTHPPAPQFQFSPISLAEPTTEPEDYVDEILGANKINNNLVLYVRWKNSGKTSWVPAKVVGLVQPEKLIAFYESKIKFELLSQKDTKTDTSQNSHQKP